MSTDVRHRVRRDRLVSASPSSLETVMWPYSAFLSAAFRFSLAVFHDAGFLVHVERQALAHQQALAQRLRGTCLGARQRHPLGMLDVPEKLQECSEGS